MEKQYTLRGLVTVFELTGVHDPPIILILIDLLLTPFDSHGQSRFFSFDNHTRSVDNGPSLRLVSNSLEVVKIFLRSLGLKIISLRFKPLIDPFFVCFRTHVRLFCTDTRSRVGTRRQNTRNRILKVWKDTIVRTSLLTDEVREYCSTSDWRVYTRVGKRTTRGGWPLKSQTGREILQFKNITGLGTETLQYLIYLSEGEVKTPNEPVWGIL